MSCALFAFPEAAKQAGALAADLGIEAHEIERRSFPDGESLVRVPASASTALLYRTLNDPNARLVEILLAASALRDEGAERVMLIAPYLAYMRQDMAFNRGEAVSQRVIGRLLADHFDGVITVDPHLHRTDNLGDVLPGIPARAISAAPALAADISGSLLPGTILIGPDSESRPWVESIAGPLGLDVLVGEKVRKGDRDVTLSVPGIEAVKGRPAILVDDLISSGGTLLACAALLREAGATSVEAIATHCIASREDLDRMKEGGIERIRASDSVPGAIGTISLSSVLGNAIRQAGWTGG